MDTRGVQVPEESELGRARDVLEELYRRAATAIVRPRNSTITGACSTGSEPLKRLSPNCDARPADARIDMLVLHYTGMRSAAEAVDRLRDPLAKVSAHYLIDEDGAVVALVPDELRAWHAGLSWWQGAAPERRVARRRARQSGARVGLPLLSRGADGGPGVPRRRSRRPVARSGRIAWWDTAT